jgi:hypothetical protein
MHFRFIGGERGTMIRGDILLHVVNHATCHRQCTGVRFVRQGRRFPHDASVGPIQGTKLLHGPTRPKPFAFLALGPCQSFLNSGFSTSLSSKPSFRLATAFCGDGPAQALP